MPSPRKQGPPAEDLIHAELRSIKENVAGVHGSVVATSDGLLIAHDLSDVEPTQVAALAATTHALALRTTLATGRGQFRETVTRGSHGYLAVYAIGDHAVVAITGTTRLNVGMLHYQAKEIIGRLARLTADLRRPTVPATAPPEPAAQEPAADASGQALPTRRPRPR